MALVLSTQEEFELLLPAVKEFCDESKSMNFVAALEEQCRALRRDRYLTIYEEKDGVVVAYLTGMLNTMPTFFITQAYSKGGRAISMQVVQLLHQLISENFTRIEFVTALNCRVFEGYGFRQKAIVMEKDVVREPRNATVGVPEATPASDR